MIGNFFYYFKFVLLLTIIMCNGYNSSARWQQGSLHIEVPENLRFTNLDGKLLAYYELYLSNHYKDTVQIKTLTITGAGDGTILLTCQQRGLANKFKSTVINKNDSSVQLMPGQTAVVYIELSLAKKEIKNIKHLIVYTIPGKQGQGLLSVQSLTTACHTAGVLVLGAPLTGGNWAAIYEPSWENGHRRVIDTVQQKAHIPGRYAIDFIQLDSSGRYAYGNEDSITNWRGYGAAVLAVADGVVTTTRNDFVESPTVSGLPHYSAELAAGNYISIKIANGKFVFYEHLRPNSIKVKTGQWVHKGEVIASLGFTGQTTGPHLHFHVADRDSPLGAEGKPYEFESFEILGSFPDLTAFGKSLWMASPANDGMRHQQHPGPNSVIRFTALK